jgi:shikimate kinase
MKGAGCVIYLRAGTDALMQRLNNSPTRRPLLEGKDMSTALMELHDKREPYYSQADHVFDVETISVANFTEIISSCTNQP